MFYLRLGEICIILDLLVIHCKKCKHTGVCECECEYKDVCTVCDRELERKSTAVFLAKCVK